eukprot:GHVP01066232.1.p1 GENE.GHVP01066232.1~~GHVP01066232.1.p1  ORF type:complete len:141 (-),score=9.19 GHVP01066232.1:16-438(-)
MSMDPCFSFCPEKDRRLENFSKLDLANGFFNIRLHSDSYKYTAFVTSIGTFEYKVHPFGLKVSLSMQQSLDSIFLHHPHTLSPPSSPVCPLHPHPLRFLHSIEEMRIHVTIHNSSWTSYLCPSPKKAVLTKCFLIMNKME